MEYNRLGNSDLMVSPVGFGCMSLLKSNSEEAASVVGAAVDAGINFFDTADLYDKGENEKLIGGLLKPVRNKVVLATKVGNQWRDDDSGWDWNPGKAHIIKAVDDSLKRLQTDYIDLYQLHGGTIEDDIDETIEAFESLVQMGKIRYYGISSIRSNVISKYVQQSNISSVMMQYSLLDRRLEESVADLLGENNISILARGVLAQGLLVDKSAKAYLGYEEAEVLRFQKELERLGNPESLALHFALVNTTVASAVVGVRTEKQLADVLKAYAAAPDKFDLQTLRQVLAPKMYTDHRK